MATPRPRPPEEIAARRGLRVITCLQVLILFLACWVVHLRLNGAPQETRYQYSTQRTAPELPERGSIRTRDGVLLAQDLVAWSIGIDPVQVEQALHEQARRKGTLPGSSPGAPRMSVDPAFAEAILSQAIREFPYGLLDRARGAEEVEERALAALRARERIVLEQGELRDRRLRYVAIGEVHDKLRVHELERWLRNFTQRTGLRCFNLESRPLRHYPQPCLANQLVGEVGRDGFGLWGLERARDAQLAGRRGLRAEERAARLRLATLDAGRGIPALEGADLTLTVEARAQQLLEAELLATHTQWQARMTLGMIVDPHTGAVRALATTPLYDRRELAALSSQERATESLRRWQRLTSYQFEPGSTIKPIVLSEVYRAGLDPHQIVTQGHKQWRYRGRTITDSTAPDRPLDIEESVMLSSNIGLAQTGLLLGPERLQDCLARFAFGQPTGLGLAEREWVGGYTAPARWTYYATTGIPFGYEISVTLPQMVRAYCAAVNGGRLVPLHVVEAVGTERVAPPLAEAAWVFPAEAAAGISARVRAVLRRAVQEGTGKRLQDPSFGPDIGLAGKTGTARISAGRDGYREDYRSTFIGFAPYDAPRYVVAVVVVEPQGEHYGGRVAGPSVRRLLGALLGAPDPELERRRQVLIEGVLAREERRDGREGR